MNMITQIQQRLFTDGPVTIFRWIAQEYWPVEYVSPNVNQWGYLPEDFLSGKFNYSDIIYPEDVIKIASEIEEYDFKKIDTYRQDYRLICANGQINWVYDYSNSIRNTQGKITHYEGYIFDITDRKKNEVALKESEEKFAKSFQCSPDSMSIAKLSDGTFINVNETFLKISGYSLEEIIGKNSLDLNLWVNAEDRIKAFEILKKEGCLKSSEYQFRHKSGEIIIGLFSAEVVSINGELCLLSVTTDITKRKQIENLLFSALQREKLLGEMALKIRQSLNLREILNTTVKEVRNFLQVTRVYIVEFNQEVKGKIVAESIDQNYSSISHWQPRNEAHIQEILEYFIFDQVYAFNDLNAIEFPLEITEDFREYKMRSFLAIPIVLGTQFFGHLVAHQCEEIHIWQTQEIDFVTKLANHLAIALHQAKLYEKVQNLNTNLEELVNKRTQELYQKMTELEELYRVKDVFLHAFSHDLRTPIMGTSLVFNSLLNNHEEKITVSRSILEKLKQGNEQQLNLMNTLLEAHSIEISGIILNKEFIEIKNFIHSIITDLQPLVNKYQGTLCYEIEKNLPLINIDSIQLRRVFENLITNALKYNPPEVIITIKISLEIDKIYFQVIDNGIGICLSQQKKIFDLYYKNIKNRTSTGIGLGLFLCKEIIIAHQGEIGVKSNINQGSNFWFTLPRL